MPFVVGYRIQTSNRVATVCPICKDLAGVYPKSFKFLGWHVQCLCTCIPIMVSDSEFDKVLADESYTPKQPQMPSQYNDHIDNFNRKNQS